MFFFCLRLVWQHARTVCMEKHYPRLKHGLVKAIGDGSETNVRIVDTTPRPPQYNQNGMVDLTLKVSDLIKC